MKTEPEIIDQAARQLHENGTEPCQHLTVTVTEGETCCSDCGVAMAYDGETRNWTEKRPRPAMTLQVANMLDPRPMGFELLPKTKSHSSKQPPPEIIQAAIRIANWFEENGEDTWELGEICSRNHATKLHAIADLTADSQ